MNVLIRSGVLAALVAAAVSAPVQAADDPDEWALVLASEDGVASLWLVRQDTDTPSLLTMQEHIELDATHERDGVGYRRFTDFDCKAGTLERGGVSVYKAESEEEYHHASVGILGIPTPEYDIKQVKPQPGSYEERVLQYACAYAAGHPDFAKVPRLDRPFYRDDAERALVAANPGYKARTYQGYAVPLVSSGVFGTTMVRREPSRQGAIAKLEAQCRANGWPECQPVVSHQCVALAYNESRLAYFIGVGAKPEQAVAQAQGYCREDGADCGGIDSVCP